jgi:hypothetical protein
LEDLHRVAEHPDRLSKRLLEKIEIQEGITFSICRMTQVTLSANPLTPGPSSLHRPEESKLFQLLSGVLNTHSCLLGDLPFAPRDLPFAPRDLGVRAFADPMCTSCAIQTSELRSPMVNGQRLSPVGVSLSGNRHMKGRDPLTLQNPECRCAMSC